MSNLLDRSSLVLTPTAYNNGEALCIKPDDASGDFQFSRNSAATRVNAQGLVENVQILSSNLVQNGDFSEEGSEEVSNGSFSQEGVQLVTNGSFDTDTNWIHRTSSSVIQNGTLSWDGTQAAADDVFQQKTGYVGKFVKMTITISAYSQGSVFLRAGSSQIPTSHSSVGTFTEVLEWVGNDYIYVKASDDFIGSIESVSVREVGQDWDTFGTIDANNTVSFANNELTLRNDGSGSGVKQDALTIGKTYKIVVNVTDIVGNGFKVDMGNLQNITTIGTKTFYLTATTASLLLYRNSTSPQAVNGATITNISVKEVGQNWTLGTGWEIGNSVAISDTTASNLTPSTTLISGEKYKFTLDVAKISAGSFTFLLRFNGTNTTFATINTEGSFTFYATADATGFRLQNLSGGTTDFSVTNITAVQISSDTNLPRINYEGFSYQDALGSELVVNGTFDSNIDFWNKGGGNVNPLSWNNGKIKITNDVAQLNSARQTIVTEIGKTYKVSADVDSTNGITPRLASSNPTTAVIGTLGTIETLTYTFTATSTSSQIELFNWQNTINKYNLWDNVSVKEYLGQEVVPDSGCGSWLFEPQSTNLLLDSGFNDVSSTVAVGYWYKTLNASVSENSAIGVDGLQSAATYTYNGGAQAEYVYGYQIPVTSGVTYTVSGYVKLGTASNFAIVLNNTTGWNSVPNGNFVATAVDGYDNWKRFEITFVAPATNKVNIHLGYNQESGVAAQTDGSVFIDSFQVEQQSYATSYIPTSGSTVTRNQDVCINGGSLASINSTEGVLYAEIAALNQTANVSQYITISDGTYNNRASILFSNGSTNSIRTFLRVGGVPQIDVSNAVSDVTDFNKIAFSYKENNFKIYLNGVLVSTDTSGSVWSADTVTKLSFSEINTTGGAFFGKTKCLAVWKEALSDAELTELTTI